MYNIYVCNKINVLAVKNEIIKWLVHYWFVLFRCLTMLLPILPFAKMAHFLIHLVLQNLNYLKIIHGDPHFLYYFYDRYRFTSQDAKYCTFMKITPFRMFQLRISTERNERIVVFIIVHLVFNFSNNQFVISCVSVRLVIEVWTNSRWL